MQVIKARAYGNSLIDAINQTAQFNRNQVRKEGAPCLAHLLAVCSLVMEHGGDEDCAIAALLHDSIENFDTSLEAIADRFGERIAQMVGELSKNTEVSEEIAQLNYLDAIAQSTDKVVLVSCADSLHTLRYYCGLTELVSAETKEHYQRLLEVYRDRMGNGHPMIYEMSGLIEKL